MFYLFYTIKTKVEGSGKRFLKLSSKTPHFYLSTFCTDILMRKFDLRFFFTSKNIVKKSETKIFFPIYHIFFYKNFSAITFVFKLYFLRISSLKSYLNNNMLYYMTFAGNLAWSNSGHSRTA